MHYFCLQVVVVGLVHSRQLAPEIFLGYTDMILNAPRDRNHHTIKWQGVAFLGSIKLLPEAVPQRRAKSLGPSWVIIWVYSGNSFMDPGKVTPCHFIVWWFLAKPKQARRLTLMLKFA